MVKKKIINVPKENVNDEVCTLIELNVKCGNYIKKGTKYSSKKKS